MSDGSNTWNYEYNADGLRTKRTNGTNTYYYYYADGQLLTMRRNYSFFRFAYDASGAPMTVIYGGETYFYVTNIQGDVIAILDDTGATVVEYTYDAWGNVLTTTGSMASTLGIINPLRYRGDIYDTDTGLYYLQSRYYDPELGRFINGDSFASTGQGLLGNNMFTYCGNNPVIYVDLDGEKIVGIGVQVELQIGGVSIGLEIVIYFDEQVCNGADYTIVAYSYSGYEISSDQLSNIIGMIDIAALAAGVEQSYNACGESDFASYWGQCTIAQVFRGFFTDGGSFTGALFIIDGYDNFDDISDYSGEFESISFNASISSHTGSVYYSTSETCRAVGLKYGRKFSSPLHQLVTPIEFGMSYSKTYYSSPVIIYEGYV